jgi:meiotically up-regulated gene 157 (Mug157) protein
MIEGVIRRQIKNVLFDPYANAYNKGNDGGGFMDDTTYKLGIYLFIICM